MKKKKAPPQLVVVVSWHSGKWHIASGAVPRSQAVLILRDEWAKRRFARLKSVQIEKAA